MLPLQVTGTKYCEDKSVPAVVIVGLALHKELHSSFVLSTGMTGLPEARENLRAGLRKILSGTVAKIPHDLDHRTYLTSNCPFPRNPLVSRLHRHGVMQDFGHSHRPPCINAISKLGVAGARGIFKVMQDFGHQPYFAISCVAA